MAGDPVLSKLLATTQDPAARDLAARYSPIIRFDAREPFLPLAAGYTIFRADAQSPSFRQGFPVELRPQDKPPAAMAIEYAIWWDWDIGHLYELEHVWVFVDESGRVVRSEASWHGGSHDMALEGHPALDGDHPVVYSQPGKHAFAPTPDWFIERARRFKRSETKEIAGMGGVLIAQYISDGVRPSPYKDLLVRTYLAGQAFEPAWNFSKEFRFSPEMMVPWPALCAWMPERVNQWLDRLAAEVPTAGYRFLRVGHRGASAHAPENTLAAFRRAAALGADMVECDVQRTTDGQTVVVHNGYLTDASGQVRLIGKNTLAQLREIDLGGGERIPTLAETLDTCREEMIGVYIEIKDGSCVGPVAAAVRERRMADHVIIGSFRPDWLANMKQIAPELRTSVLFGSPYIDAVKLAQSVQAAFVHPCWESLRSPSAALTPEWIAAVRGANLGIVCWHEERPAEIAALRRIGVDAVCSDAPELLL